MNQHVLYGLMAEALVRLTGDAWDFPQPKRTAKAGQVEPIRVKAGGAGSGRLLGAFASGGYMLVALGVAEFIDCRGRGSSWRYLVDGDRVAEFVASRSKSGSHELPPFNELFEAWTSCASHFGLISTAREPFVPHDDMLPVLRAFVHNGYAWERGSYFLWTDAIGDAMQQGDLWNENNVPFDEIEEREVDADLAKALESVPYDVVCAAHKGDVLEVWAALCGRWRDGIWLSELPRSERFASTVDIGASRRFIEMIVDNARPTKSH